VFIHCVYILQVDGDYWFQSDPQVGLTELWGYKYLLSTLSLYELDSLVLPLTSNDDTNPSV
jgi:hypothetical protein